MYLGSEPLYVVSGVVGTVDSNHWSGQWNVSVETRLPGPSVELQAIFVSLHQPGKRNTEHARTSNPKSY